MNPNNRPQSKYTDPATPINRDTMPREVAIAMLTEPKAKLTNTQRKRCKEALVRIFLSPVPLVRRRDSLGIKWGSDRKFFVGIGCTEAQRDFNHETKMAGFTYEQLTRWKVTLWRKRLKVQSAYVKIDVEVPDETSRARALRLHKCAVLEMLATRLDGRRDAVLDELDRRKKICTSSPVNI